MEALVLAICLQNEGGCNESVANYLRYNPDIRHQIRLYERRMQSYEELAPLILIGTIYQGKATFLHKGNIFRVECNEQKFGLTWRVEF